MEKTFMILLLLLTLNLEKARASTFFAPDADTALLVELVTTTVSQLHELEQLVSNGEKLTGDLKKYNALAVNHWYRAQRVAHLVEGISTLKDARVQNLGELNSALRSLKDSISEMEDLIVQYGLIRKESENIQRLSHTNDARLIQEKGLAEVQVERTHRITNLGNIHKANAQINAYANRNLVDMKNQLNQQLKLLSRQNQILAQEKEKEAARALAKKTYYRPDWADKQQGRPQGKSKDKRR